MAAISDARIGVTTAGDNHRALAALRIATTLSMAAARSGGGQTPADK
jgi:hypothetical protein